MTGRRISGLAQIKWCGSEAIRRSREITAPIPRNAHAVRWKLMNLEKLRKDNPDKHAEQRGALEALFK